MAIISAVKSTVSVGRPLCKMHKLSGSHYEPEEERQMNSRREAERDRGVGQINNKLFGRSSRLAVAALARSLTTSIVSCSATVTGNLPPPAEITIAASRTSAPWLGLGCRLIGLWLELLGLEGLGLAALCLWLGYEELVLWLRYRVRLKLWIEVRVRQRNGAYREGGGQMSCIWLCRVGQLCMQSAGLHGLV